MRSFLAYITHKHAHVAVPKLHPSTIFDWKMGVTHLEPVSLTVPPLPELTQSLTNCVSPANAFVIVLALNSKCHIVLLANAKGTILNVQTLVEDNGCYESDTDDS